MIKVAIIGGGGHARVLSELISMDPELDLSGCFDDSLERGAVLWNGVKENSFGLVFGPPKSGKTIFCENLAISLALGRNQFMGFPIDKEPQKVMFIGLEEFWRNRFERNAKQFSTLSDDEKELFKSNFLFPDTEFPKTITTKENWKLLKKGFPF